MKASRQRKFIPSARTRSLRAGYARLQFIEAHFARYTQSIPDGQQTSPAPKK